MRRYNDLPGRKQCMHCERTAIVLNRCHSCDWYWRRNRVRLICRLPTHRYTYQGFCIACRREKINEHEVVG